MKIDGRQIAVNILEDLKIKVNVLRDQGITPTMAVILIGNVKSSESYVKQKELKAKIIGAGIKIFRFNETVTNEEIAALIKKLDADKNVHGIILQRPTPKNINADLLENLISPIKEIDGFGKNPLYTVPVAGAVFEILDEIFGNLNEMGSFSVWLAKKKVVILGKGETAGMPIINYFKNREIDPIVIDSKTENANAILSSADIIISAVGKREVIKTEELKQGVILIGVGISTDDEEKTQGDYDENKLEEIASFYTSTPGGVGPVNVALLMENLVQACQNLSR